MAQKNKIRGKKKEAINNYLWRGINHRGVRESGEIEAASPALARLLLRQRGLRVSRVRKESKPLFSRDKVTPNDIVIISRQLATLVEGGIPIAQALTAVGQSSDKKSVKKLLATLRRRVDSGVDLTTTLRDHPQHFNKLYIALVNVGEKSGTLGPMLKRIASYLEKAEALRRKVVSALTYPVIVSLLGISIAAGLLIFVIPQFKDVFQNFGTELPALTRWVIAASEALQKNIMQILIGIVIVNILFRLFYQRNARFHLLIDRAALKIPVFGRLIQKSILARIARTVAIMFHAGIPMVETLATITPAAGNQVYTNALLSVTKNVSSGQPLEASLRTTRVFPGMILQMVRTGEETGELDAMLNRAADFYEDEVDAMVSAISSLIEPLLVVILGAIIGVVIVAMYLPIFHLASVF